MCALHKYHYKTTNKLEENYVTFLANEILLVKVSTGF